jgi:hypothetical protein
MSSLNIQASTINTTDLTATNIHSNGGAVEFIDSIDVAVGKTITSPLLSTDVIIERTPSAKVTFNNDIQANFDVLVASGKFVQTPTLKVDTLQDNGAGSITSNSRINVATLHVDTLQDNGAGFINSTSQITVGNLHVNNLNTKDIGQINFNDHMVLIDDSRSIKANHLTTNSGSTVTLTGSLETTANVKVDGTLEVDTVSQLTSEMFPKKAVIDSTGLVKYGKYCGFYDDFVAPYPPPYSSDADAIIQSAVKWKVYTPTTLNRLNLYFDAGGSTDTTGGRGLCGLEYDSSASDRNFTFSTDYYLYTANGTMEIEARLAFTDPTVVTRFYFGFVDNTSLESSGFGTYYVMTTFISGVDTHFVLSAAVGGSASTNASSVVFSTLSGYVKLRVRLESGLVKFYYNDVLSATINSFTMTNTKALRPVLVYTKNSLATDGVIIDYINLKQADNR